MIIEISLECNEDSDDEVKLKNLDCTDTSGEALIQIEFYSENVLMNYAQINRKELIEAISKL